MSNDDSKFAEVPAQRIDELGALAHEALRATFGVALILSCSVGHEYNDSVFVVADLGTLPIKCDRVELSGDGAGTDNGHG